MELVKIDDSRTLKSAFGYSVDCFDSAVQCLRDAYSNIAMVRAHCGDHPGLVVLEAALRHAIKVVPEASPRTWTVPLDDYESPDPECCKPSMKETADGRSD